MSVESGGTVHLKRYTGRVISTCKSTGGYSHFKENVAQNVLDVRVASHMVENETNRIREFCLCSHVAQTHSGDLCLIAEFIRHYTLQRIPPEHIFLRRSLRGCIVMVVDCPLMLDYLGDVKYFQLFPVARAASPFLYPHV